MKILHISDTHFHHRNDSNVPLLKRMEALKAYPDPVIIITGDVTDDGRPDQRKKAFEALKALPNRVIILPGNHDYGAFGTFYNEVNAEAFDSFAAEFGEQPFINKSVQVIQIENVIFLLLNSCLKTQSPFDFASGEIGTPQRDQLRWFLDQPSNVDLIKLVALHHHPFIHGDPTMELLDAKEFMRVIFGKVDILLFGHIHEEGYWHNKSGCKEILAAGALFESASVKEITIEGDQISVKRIFLL